MNNINKEKIVNRALKQIIFITVMTLIFVMIIVALSIALNKKPTVEVITKTDIQTVEVEKEVVIEIKKEPNYTYDELYCMAVVIYNEAGSNVCTDEQQELVGYVVLNRVNDSRYPNTIREVLTQKGQYAGIWDNGVYFAKRGNSETEVKALERAWITAQKVLENRNNIPIPENVIFQAQFKQGSGIYKQIGNTYFCY